MPARINRREVIGRATPKRYYEFGEKIAAQLQSDDKAKREAYERSGKISGGKLGQPTLWAVLDLIGVPREFDPYLLGKFKRGNDVEERAINFLTGIKPSELEDGKEITAPEGAVLTGVFVPQKSGGYRGGVGYIDLAQKLSKSWVYHEIKSSTKMAYDRVAASGRYHNQVDEAKGIGMPYYHHCIQLAYYCLGDGVDTGFLHYFNADDYRLTTFAINPHDYKEEIDKEIDDIQLAFASKQLPVFEAFLDYHTAYKKTTYGEWNDLNAEQLMYKLEREYPEQYKKFLEMTM